MRGRSENELEHPDNKPKGRNEAQRYYGEQEYGDKKEGSTLFFLGHGPIYYRIFF